MPPPCRRRMPGWTGSGISGRRGWTRWPPRSPGASGSEGFVTNGAGPRIPGNPALSDPPPRLGRDREVERRRTPPDRNPRSARQGVHHKECHCADCRLTTPAVPTALNERAQHHLRALVGSESATLRDDQWTAIDALVAEQRRRALVVQRTGWGKSAVYFVATALLRERGGGPTVIISPLLALMRNQIAAAAAGRDPGGHHQFGQRRAVGRGLRAGPGRRRSTCCWSRRNG